MKKKAVFIVIGLFFLLFLVLLLLPVIFKNDIKEAIDKEIAQYVNAEVNYAADDFSLSIFRSFPDITAGLDNFSIVGREDFEGDTLLSVASFNTTIDVWSVLFGEIMEVKAISLESPRIFAKVNRIGKANWDIIRPQPIDTTQADTTEVEAPLRIDIDKWKISNGLVEYDDRSTPMYVKIESLNHTGRGQLEENLFDLVTETDIAAFTLDFDGVNYLNNKKIEADITLGMDMANAKYTFKDNNLKVNDFEMSFDGFVAMPDTNIQMDIRFKTLKNDFKTLLSLVPGAYTENFDEIETKGILQFDGDVKGIYNATQLPSFHLNLKVEDAMFHYPDLPTVVDNIQMDLGIKNDDGNLDNTVVDLRTLHLDLGKNPVDAKVLIEGLSQMKIDADVKASLNLADLVTMFPIEGIDLRGFFKVNVQAKGIYDGQRMPIVNANMVLSNGYIKSKDFPIPLEKVNLQALAKSDGTLPNSEVDLQRFYMLLDGKPFEAQAFIKNFDDIDFDVKAKGSVDLTKMTKIYPIEGMTLAGIMKADLATKGKMSYVEASQYDKIPTSGMLSLKDFVYETADMPTVKITTAQLNFDPTAMQLERLEGFAGKSDVQMTGSINNYLGYLLKDEVLQGAFTFSSNKFDVNEWMVEETGAASTEEVPLTVVEVPKDIDFLLASTINEVTYDNLNLKNLKGNILVKEGVITLQKLFFNTLGGEVIADGTYDTRDMAHPKFDIDFGIKKMSIKEASEAFITVNKIAPLAQAMSGEFTTNFKLGGELGQDMMPLFNTLNGSGLINILKGTIKDAPVVKQLSNVTQLSNLNPMGIADVLMQAEVKDGRVYFQPYDVNIAGYKTTVQGSNGLDGSLDYQLNMDLPAGAVGKQLNSSIASLTGQSFSGNENVKLNLGVGGKYTSPKVKLLGAGGKTVKEQIKEVAKDNVVVNKAKEDTQEKAEEILAEARRQAAQVKQTAKQQADAIRREADANEKKMVDEAVKQAGSNPIAKKAARKAAEKTAAKAKQEAYRKADQLEREADKKADGIIQKAEQEANRLK